MTVPSVNGLLYRRRITRTPRRSLPRVGQVCAPRHDPHQRPRARGDQERHHPMPPGRHPRHLGADHRLHRHSADHPRLHAVAGGNEVTNPFVASEVYVQPGGARILASMSFTRASSLPRTLGRVAGEGHAAIPQEGPLYGDGPSRSSDGLRNTSSGLHQTRVWAASPKRSFLGVQSSSPRAERTTVLSWGSEVGEGFDPFLELPASGGEPAVVAHEAAGAHPSTTAAS